MPTLHFAARLGSLLLAGILVSACSKQPTTDGSQATGTETLPAPAANGGSVTGMPDPGVATPQPPPLDTPQVPAEATTPADATSPAAIDPNNTAPSPAGPAPASPAPPVTSATVPAPAEPVSQK